jgi:hypothetical protein
MPLSEPGMMSTTSGDQTFVAILISLLWTRRMVDSADWATC